MTNAGRFFVAVKSEKGNGKIDWQKTWKLAKMAVKAYLQK